MINDLVSTYKCFYLLDKLSSTGNYSVSSIAPEGNDPVDFVDVVEEGGSLLAVWKDPIQFLSYQNVVVSDGLSEQIVNLSYIERAIDIYDRPPSSDIGTFLFMKSAPIPSQDWRCDQGKYGGMLFNVPTIPYGEAAEIRHYEVLLPLNGCAQIAYSEGKTRQPLSDYLVDGDEVPSTTRTLAELLRLVYEWSEVHDDPFNNTDEVSQRAHDFVQFLGLTETEVSLLEAQTPMQVSNYLTGSLNARQRPGETSPTSDDFMKLLFKRMACSSLSALVQLHSLPWDTEELVSLERQQLLDGITRFKNFYLIDESVNLLDEGTWQSAIESSRFGISAESFMSNQLRTFKNKNTVLDLVLSGKFG